VQVRKRFPLAKNPSEDTLSKQSQPKVRRQFLPVNYRGLLFDLFVFVFNVFLIRFLTRRIGGLLSRTFLKDDPQAGRILLAIISAALIAQIIGALLKRRPLQARQLAQHNEVPGVFNILLILHFALTLVTAAGILALLPFESAGGVTVLIAFLSMVPTAFVWRAMTPYKKTPTADWRNSRAVETVADVFLFANMLVNLAIWFTLTAGSNLPVSGVGDLFSRSLGFIILSPVVLLFYLPPRLLFLVEDYKYRATWLSMMLAIAPVAYRVIFGSALKTDW
jgi:hypothetical protein